MKKESEASVEAYLVKRVKALGGEVRKVSWVGRVGAPDRVVMLCLDGQGCGPHTIWVELKNPQTVASFPANGHERAQAREHARMRKMGQRVAVIGTRAQVDEMLS